MRANYPLKGCERIASPTPSASIAKHPFSFLADPKSAQVSRIPQSTRESDQTPARSIYKLVWGYK